MTYSHRILIVDNDPNVTSMLSEALGTEPGYDVAVCSDGSAAIATLAAGSPVDLMLVDRVLPDVSGEKIAARGLEAGVAVLLTSGYPDGAEVAARLGVGFLAKPFHIEHLLAKVRETLLSARKAEVLFQEQRALSVQIQAAAWATRERSTALLATTRETWALTLATIGRHYDLGLPSRPHSAFRGRPKPSGLDVQIGARLRERRLMLGISQAQLGQALGVTFQQVQKYEHGVNRLAGARLWALAQLLGVSLQYFYETAAPAASPDQGAGEPETQELLRAYGRISDPRMRQRVLEMIQELAAKDDGGTTQ